MRAAFLLLLAMFFAVTSALPAADQNRRAPGVQALDQILPEVRRTNPGRFYDVEGPTPAPDGSEHYSLKWMTPDGRIEWLDTDARTGRVLGPAPGPARNFAPAPSLPVPQNFTQRPRENGNGYEA